MNKLILICLLFVVPTAFTADCTGNALVAKVGLTRISTSTTATTLEYCQGLQTLDICCSADTINSIQTTIDTLVQEVVVEAAARDTYLIGARAALAASASAFKTLQTTAAATKAAVATAAGAQNPAASVTAWNTELQAGGLETIYEDLEEALENAAKGWSDYQKNRAACANKVFEAQASAYCLACRLDPTATAIFATTTDETTQLDYLDTYEAALQAACSPYLLASATQNLITRYYILSSNVASLNTLLTTVGSAAAQMTQTNLVSYQDLIDLTLPTANYQEIPSLTACNNNGCAYVSSVLLDKGTALNTDYLANGGTINPAEPSASSSRVLGETRTLAGAEYNPTSDDNKSGVTVDFPEDPIAYLSAWRQGGLMTCVVALVAMLLF